VNKGKNLPSFQMLSALCVIGKIRVRFDAGDAPFTMKAKP
jgi:hypothetical protein